MPKFLSAIAHVMIAAAATLPPATGITADFVIEKTEAYGAWSATLYRNIKGNRLFCAIEASDGRTDLRINRYKASGDTFLELYNPDWTMMQGEVRFRLNFEIDTEIIEAEFRGKSWGDSYTYDFTDVKIYQTLLVFIAGSDSFEVLNSNGAAIARFSGDGAGQAVQAYNTCVRT